MDQYLFIFLVDRSGSMSGSRMDLTKEALKLFIQSLPLGCSFAILGFGDTSKALFEVPNWDTGCKDPISDVIW